MSWNGSDQSNRATSKKSPDACPLRPGTATRRLYKIGIIFALVIVALGSAALWYWMRPSTLRPIINQKISDKSQIVSVMPHIATNTSVSPKQLSKPIDQSGTIRNKRSDITKGWVTFPDGTRHYRRGLKKVAAGPKRCASFAIFEHSTDNEIAALLTLKSGDGLIGGPLYHGGDYKSAFLKSLETPITVNPDDSEEQAELKRGVIEARKELKAKLDRGEDLNKVIEECYNEAHRIATYRGEIEKMVSEHMKDGGLSDADISDLYGAANSMLEQKGISPIKFGPVARAKLKAMRRRQNKNTGKNTGTEK